MTYKFISVAFTIALALLFRPAPLPAQSNWNSGFEQGFKDWHQPVIQPKRGQKPGHNSVTIVTNPTHEGKHALKIEAGSWSPSISVRSQLQPLIEHQPYRKIHLWYLYKGPRGRKFGVKVRLYDAGRKPLADAEFKREGSPIPSGDWFPLTLQFPVSQQARFYTVELFWAVGTGQVTFDQITLGSLAAPTPVRTGYRLASVSNAQADVWIASALEKIYPDATAPKSIGRKIKLSAARGESQSIQLIYRPKTVQHDLSVSVDELQTASDAEKPPAQIIDVRYVGDVEIKDHISQFGRGGPTPDPLFPTPPAEIAAGKPQSIWITARVPCDAAAGTYNTKVHVRTDHATMDIPLQLRVFDFALPVQPFLHTNAASPHLNPAARDALREHLLANRITSEISYGGGVQSLSLKLNPDHTVTIDWAPWDAAIEKYRRQGMTQFLVPCLLFGNISGIYGKGTWQYVRKSGTVTFGTPQWDTAVGSYVRQMYAHLKEKGWLKDAIWEIWDEPMGTKMRAEVRKIAALVRKNAPDAKIMVTGWPVKPVDPNIDIWCPQQNLYEPALRQLSDGAFWIYNNGLYTIDQPTGLTAMRRQTWWMWNNDITGLLWWGTTYGWNTDLYHRPNPYPSRNGDGFLFYPGKDGDQSKVIDSMRIAAYRTGVNDYDYFSLLAQAQDKAVKQLNLSGKAPSGRELVKTLISAGLERNDPNRMEAIRDLAAFMIVALHRQPEIAWKLTGDDWLAGQLQGLARPNASITLDGQPIKADSDGRFTVSARAITEARQ